ncbi:MAG TPA: outer membrane beta-barrel protein, partial [Chitinophaga sp.]
EREDGYNHSFSRTSSSLNTSQLKLEEATLRINYNPNKQQTFNAEHSFQYDRLNSRDSLGYQILYDGLLNQLNQHKQRRAVQRSFNTKLQFEQRFAKPGKMANIEVCSAYRTYHTTEQNQVYDQQTPLTYYLQNTRTAVEATQEVNISFTEPFNEQSYARPFAHYVRKRISYHASAAGDTLEHNINDDYRISGEYAELGIQYYQNLKRFTFGSTFAGMSTYRGYLHPDTTEKWFNLNATVNLHFMISKHRSLSGKLQVENSQPTLEQLTNINNTMDLVNQTSGNTALRPELKQSAEINYSAQKSPSTNLSVSGTITRYKNKLGIRVDQPSGVQQTSYLANLGQATSADLRFTLSHHSDAGRYINYSTGFSYQEIPIMFGPELSTNGSITHTQSFTTVVPVMRGILELSPTLNGSYIRLAFDKSYNTMLTLTYADKVTVNIHAFQLNLYPVLIYTQNINSRISFATNASVTRSILKTYGVIWLQVYDLFNSFRYDNSLSGASFIQSTSYANPQRYIMFGFSLKFNNMR